MHTDLIIIGSITYAMKAKNALQSIGIRATIRKLKSTSHGCSYALDVPPGQLLAIASALRSAGISYELAQ